MRTDKIIRVQGNDIIHIETGEVLGSTTPKFQGWKYEDYLNEFIANKQVRYLEPMTAQELDHDKLESYISENVTVAEQKFDGHRGLIYFTEKGNRMFSRRVSKQTGWFAENSDTMPQIRDIQVRPEFYGTVIDGEILLPVENCSCREVQSVTGALPETAIKNQLEKGLAYMEAFDILYYKGINIQAMPYWKRKLYLWKVICEANSPFIGIGSMYCSEDTAKLLRDLWGDLGKYRVLNDLINVVEDYDSLFRQFLKEGKEGLIIKDIYARYEQKRTKSFIKMKAHETFDVVIMGYEPPKKEVDPNERKTSMDEWQYWADSQGNRLTSRKQAKDSVYTVVPVTKFYAMDWIGALIFGVWKDGELIEVGRTSGLDEPTRKEISKNKDKYIGKVIEVEAQGIINKDTGSLQHPRFVQFRPDKNSEQCTFNEHVRNY